MRSELSAVLIHGRPAYVPLGGAEPTQLGDKPAVHQLQGMDQAATATADSLRAVLVVALPLVLQVRTCVVHSVAFLLLLVCPVLLHERVDPRVEAKHSAKATGKQDEKQDGAAKDGRAVCVCWTRDIVLPAGSALQCEPTDDSCCSCAERVRALTATMLGPPEADCCMSSDSAGWYLRQPCSLLSLCRSWRLRVFAARHMLVDLHADSSRLKPDCSPWSRASFL